MAKIKKIDEKVGFQITNTHLVINYPDRGDKWFSLKSLKITPTVINYPVLNYPNASVVQKKITGLQI